MAPNAPRHPAKNTGHKKKGTPKGPKDNTASGAKGGPAAPGKAPRMRQGELPLLGAPTVKATSAAKPRAKAALKGEVVSRAQGVAHQEADAAWPPYLAEFRGLVRQHDMALWAARYLKDEVAGIQAANTLQAKVRDLTGFVQWLVKTNGEATISQWLPRDTQGYLRDLERRKMAATTINRVFASIRRFARWAQEQPGGLFNDHGSPVRGIKELVTEEPDCKKLEATDVHRVLRAADRLVDIDTRKNARPRRNRAILALLYYTGMRVSELAALELGQLRDGYLHNVARKGRTRTKALYLVKDCRDALEDYLTHERVADDLHKDEKPLFLAIHGGHIRRQQIYVLLQGIAQEASKKLKVPIHLHPHRLRHTFGAMFRDKSGSDTETAAALGHTGLAHVKRYVRKSQKEREEVLERVFGSF